jgi:hypothetical protein
MSKKRPAATFPVVRHAPGMEATQGLPNGGGIDYQYVFFGATREYLDEKDGWVTIRHRSHKKRKHQSN